MVLYDFELFCVQEEIKKEKKYSTKAKRIARHFPPKTRENCPNEKSDRQDSFQIRGKLCHQPLRKVLVTLLSDSFSD